jgi:sugar lactone lactonase YvrE
MRKITIVWGMVWMVILPLTDLSAMTGLCLAEGEAEVLVDFADPIPGVELASPEGIAFDWMGNMYISLRTKRLSDGAYLTNDIIKINRHGEDSVLASLGLVEEGSGTLGLTTDWKRNVYVAFHTNDERNGVWKISPRGTMEHVSGSEQMKQPNALVVDWYGNLYCTDSDPDLEGEADIWIYPRKRWGRGHQKREFKPWAENALLSGGTDEGPVLVGANGIAFVPPNKLYVANTNKSLLVHVPINWNGSAGEPAVIAAGWPMMSPDGLAVDVCGNVYTVSPMSTFPTWFGLPPLSPVLRIIPSTGEIQPVVPFGDWTQPVNPHLDDFDMPTSLAYGKGPWDRRSVFVVGISMASFGLPPGTGAKLTQVGTGQLGLR